MKGDLNDPKALIREAYRIEGITLEECRSIFIDWALSVESSQTPELLKTLLANYGPDHPDHPMTQVLHEGTMTPPNAKRRGGRAARISRN